jgi:hypothetical protein
MVTSFPRPWREITREIAVEQNLERIQDLSRELNRALAEQKDSPMQPKFQPESSHRT